MIRREMDKVRVLRVVGIALLCALAIPFVPVSFFPLFDRPTAQDRPASQQQRVAMAASRGSMLDLIADLVYGQPDFVSRASIDPPTATSLHGASAAYIFDDTGQIFVADTENHRVLGWDSVDEYENGDAADVVLGQPDFESNTPNNGGIGAATLHSPSAVVMDIFGTLYVADTGNNRILGFEPEFDDEDIPIFTSGMEASLVIGQADFSEREAPDPPTETSLNHPIGIALDSRQNLVVADRDNNRVLIFEAPLESGMAASYVLGQPRGNNPRLGDLTTNVAPDPPTAQSLNHPSGVAIGALADELYVADTGNHRVLIYERVPLDRIADHVVGQPDFVSNTANAGGVSASSLNGPQGVNLDSADRLFVADTENHRVLVFVDPRQSKTADQVLGQPDFESNTANNGGISAASLNGPVAVANDNLFRDIFIADQGNNRVLHYYQPLENGQPQIVELAPNTARVGRDAFTLEVRGTGFVEDSVVRINGAVRAATFAFDGIIEVPMQASDFTATGAVSVTVAAPAPGGGLSAPETITIYEPQAGDLAADRVLGQLGFNTADGDFVPPSASTLYYPFQIAIHEASGRLFVADTDHARVLSWPNAADFADYAPADLVIGQANFTDIEAGLWIDESLSDRTVGYPEGLAVDQAGNLYVADTYNHRVLIFDALLSTGMAASVVIGQPDFTTGGEPGAPTGTTLAYPGALAVDGDGNLYVADSENRRILRFDAPFSNGMAASLIIGQPDFTSPPSAATFSTPYGVAVDAAGNLYVADSENNRVLIFNAPLSDGMTASVVLGQSSVAGRDGHEEGVSAASFNFPQNLEIDDGDLYVADANNGRVLRFRAPFTDGMAAELILGQQRVSDTVRGNRSAVTLSRPIGVAVDAGGNVAVSDFADHRILVFDRPAAGSSTDEPAIYLPLLQR